MRKTSRFAAGCCLIYHKARASLPDALAHNRFF